MISKISYIKLIWEDIRHRGWLAALSGVLFFLSMPVYTLIYLDSYSDLPEISKEFADTFSGFISGYNSAFLIILIGILGVTIGISGFQFMHKKEKLDFYHGLPLKRHQLFGISYLSGLFLFLVPYVICTVLTILVGSRKRNYDPVSYRRMFSVNGSRYPRIPPDLSHMYFCRNADRTKRNDVPRNTCHRRLSKPCIDAAAFTAGRFFPNNI